MSNTERPATGQITAHIDATGLHCPVPLIRCLAKLHTLAPGSLLEVTVSNRDALHDILLLLRRGPHQLTACWQDACGDCHFIIRKRTAVRQHPHRPVSILHWFRQRLGCNTPILPVSGG